MCILFIALQDEYCPRSLEHKHFKEDELPGYKAPTDTEAAELDFGTAVLEVGGAVSKDEPKPRIMTQTKSGTLAHLDDITAPFPKGTQILISAPKTPPPGWERVSSLDGRTLVLTDGDPSLGGEIDFKEMFKERVLSGSVSDHTLTVDQMPGHSHKATSSYGASSAWSNNRGGDERRGYGGFPTYSTGKDGESTTETGLITTNIENTGGGKPHGHGLKLDKLDLRVKYASAYFIRKI